MTLELPLKVYVNDKYREAFLKLNGNHYHIKSAQEIVDEVIEESKRIIVK